MAAGAVAAIRIPYPPGLWAVLSVHGAGYGSPGSDSGCLRLFVCVFKALKGFRSTEGSFATWLTRLTRNLLIDHHRRTRNERVTDSIDDQVP